ncbi:hypothetical protein DL771_003250 [Monosporascus sp. 5C6A]|nr:hypothetical protein DL771_003250 [Monosporascus sp. 5C6A]
MEGIVGRIRRNKVATVVISVFDWYLFCRFLGQQNITNAYVTGMREELNAFGNELNYYKVAYSTAYVVGQIPLMTLQTKAKIAPYLLPSLQILWAIIAFCQSKVTQNWHLYFLRALTGFLEASSFGGTHLILGSWFKNEELFKRAGVWFMGNSLGSMFSGYLQAAAYRNLNGVNGRAGWRWLFIIRPHYTADCFHRLRVLAWSPDLNEALVVDTSCMIQANYWTSYMALWLRSTGYSIELVNILPTFIDLIRALSSWVGTTLAGCLSLRDALKFLAFYFGGFSGMASPILYSWVNSTLKENYGERGLIISSMMTFGYCTQIWVPLFTFPTVQAPEFRNGYPASTVFEFTMWAILMFGVGFMARWKRTHPDAVPESADHLGVSGSGTDLESEIGQTAIDRKH